MKKFEDLDDLTNVEIGYGLKPEPRCVSSYTRKNMAEMLNDWVDDIPNTKHPKTNKPKPKKKRKKRKPIKRKKK